MSTLFTLAQKIGECLKAQHATLTTAESCTGGGLSYAITHVPGSSHWFHYGYVTYSEQAKIELLNVPAALLAEQGAVSEAVALDMAKNALSSSHATWSIATTGVAGPDGSTPECPVGTVWIGWANQSGFQFAKRYSFSGDRHAIREQTIEKALTVLLELLSK